MSHAARRIGILGGTFDPIHRGHLDAGLAAESALGLTRTIVITAAVPPHRPQPAASSYHRFTMAAIAVAGRAGWRASDLELRHAERSYTSATLERFHTRGYRPSELYFVLGADAFAEIESWKNFPAILDYTHFAVVSRPGFPVGDLPTELPRLATRMTRPQAAHPSEGHPLIILIDTPTADVSSTAIRERRARGDSIVGMVPDGVRQHIEQHGLYTSSSPGRRAMDSSGPDAAGPLQDEE